MSEVREILKAFKRRKDKDHNDLLFGTLYSGRCRVLRDERRWPIVEPDLAIDPPELPVGWEWGREDDNSAFPQVFCARWFQVQHGLKFRHPRGGRMPEEILWLLSGSLQTGEDWSYSNYQKYCRLKNLTFLPFLVTNNHFRFFVFRPTTERVKTAITTFQEVLTRLKFGNPNCTYWYFWANHVLRDVRIDECNDPELSQHRWRGMPVAGPVKPLAFVYRDLKGPQDAVHSTLD